jgi:hypothetical protein
MTAKGATVLSLVHVRSEAKATFYHIHSYDLHSDPLLD